MQCSGLQGEAAASESSEESVASSERLCLRYERRKRLTHERAIRRVSAHSREASYRHAPARLLGDRGAHPVSRRLQKIS